MIVYVITYADEQYIGVFSTKEKAENHLKTIGFINMYTILEEEVY